MLSKSPIKSPIQKISTAGNKLVTAASTAVQHGTQLSNAVKTKANNIAEDFAKVDELHRRTSADTNSKKLSPSKRHQSKSSTTKRSPSRKSPNRNNGVGSRGIRDRINMFESSDNVGGGYSPHRTAAAAASSSRPIPEKENDTNSTTSTSVGKGYAFTSKDGVKKLSPVLRRKKKVKSPSRTSPTRSSKSSEGERSEIATNSNTKSPRKRNSPKKKLSPHKRNLYKLGEVDDEEEEDTLLGEAINTSIEYDQQPNDTMLSSRDERPMLGTRGKSESSTSSSSSSGMKRKSYQLDSINEDKPELNRSTSNRSEGSAGLLFTTTSQKQTHHRCTTPILNNQIPTKFNSNERDNTSQSHTLIQSPLRKHMKVVHDSACSGATCTIKQPFPLLLPNELNSHQKKQAELNELGSEEADGSGRSPYLDTLGNVCGTPGMITRSKSDPTADSKCDSKDGEGREEGKEAALDLLSSAAFLFKTSRRKLI